MDALSSSSCSKLNSMAPFLPKKLLKGSHEEIQLRAACDRLVNVCDFGMVKLPFGFQIVLALLVQFCQPQTISPPYFPQTVPLANLLPIQNQLYFFIMSFLGNKGAMEFSVE